MQFREVTAEVFYKAMLLDSTALYTIAESPEKLQILTLMPPDVSFQEWDWLTYCQILAHYWNQPVEDLYGGNIGRASSLAGENNEFLVLDPNLQYRFLVPDKWKEATNREFDQLSTN
jgi:hypothetical protein